MMSPENRFTLFGIMLWCMSPKSAQRFWDNDMHKNND